MNSVFAVVMVNREDLRLNATHCALDVNIPHLKDEGLYFESYLFNFLFRLSEVKIPMLTAQYRNPGCRLYQNCLSILYYMPP